MSDPEPGQEHLPPWMVAAVVLALAVLVVAGYTLTPDFSLPF